MFRTVVFTSLILVLGGIAHADFIDPVSVTGSGSFNNNPNILIDGALTVRGGDSVALDTVSWGAPSAVFIIDLGALYTVDNLTVYVDNNDDYIFRYSADGVNYLPLFTFLGTAGPQPVHPGGQDILTTDPNFPSSPSNNTVPAYVGSGFAPVDARFLELTAARSTIVDSDQTFGAGEIRVFGTAAVPEPASLALFGIGAGVGLIFRRRLRALLSK